MRNICTVMLKWLDLVLLLAGMVLIAWGVFLIYVPAGYIISGFCCIANALLIAKKQVGGGSG